MYLFIVCMPNSKYVHHVCADAKEGQKRLFDLLKLTVWVLEFL